MSTDGNDPTYPDRNNAGLTKREYFAALAMQAILSDPKDMESEDEANEGAEMDEMEGGGKKYYGRRDGESCMECCCRIAVEHADELIKALNR
jgi:hypothetical protein